MTFFNNDNYDWSGLIQHLDEQEQEQPEPTTTTTTTTTTTYEFLPEIWNKIKEYTVPKKYEYDEEDCVYEVKINRFLETIVDNYAPSYAGANIWDKSHYEKEELVVETDGSPYSDFTGTKVDVGNDEWTGAWPLVYDGECQPKFSKTCKAVIKLTDLIPYDVNEWWGDGIDVYSLALRISMGERGYEYVLLDSDGDLFHEYWFEKKNLKGWLENR